MSPRLPDGLSERLAVTGGTGAPVVPLRPHEGDGDPSAMVSRALILAADGFAVFPCFEVVDGWCTCQTDCSSPGKHPRTSHGVNDASTDPARVRGWWSGTQRRSNIGIACGPSGLLVLDEDQPADLDRLCADHGEPVPKTRTVRTAKGRHLWFRQPDGEPVGNVGRLKKTGYAIDVRGRGGYAMGPGSTHETGHVYEFEDLAEIAELPGWLLSLLRPEPEHKTGTSAPVSTPAAGSDEPVTAAGAKAALDAACQDLATAPEGTRNPTLNDKAYRLGRMVAGGLLDGTEVQARLTAAAAAAGLTGDEVGKTLRSGLEAGARHPRPVASDEDEWERKIRERYDYLAVDHEARARLAADTAPPIPPFEDLGGWASDLITTDPEPFRVEGLIPADAGTLVVAQRKTGKTTFVLNLARSLLTGEPFLGGLATEPVRGTVALLNYEVTGRTVAQWAADLSLPLDRLLLVTLRGRVNPLSTEAGRRFLAAELRARQVESLVVDPFGRAYTDADQNDAGKVGSWLTRLDRFAREGVGVRDLVLVAHAGWNAERSRGSSALEDWADSVVTLTRDEVSGDRYLRAMGRDVLVDEDRLSFDADSRSLTLTGEGDRKVAGASRRTEVLADAVLQFVTEHPECSQRDVEQGVRGTRELVRDAVRSLVASGDLVRGRRAGAGGGTAFSVSTPHKQPVLGGEDF